MWWWVIIAFLLLVLPSNGYSLDPRYAASMKDNLKIIIDRHPAYVWGEAKDESRGLDCSGYMYLAAKRSGLPVRRVTAREMREGKGCWEGRDISLKDAEEVDMPYWTWKDRPDRQHGHVGCFLQGKKSKLLEVTHCGSSTGVVQHELKGVFLRDLSAVRHLTIGDRKEKK
jgi:hypothetical protein